jgi:hypothetical protein
MSSSFFIFKNIGHISIVVQLLYREMIFLNHITFHQSYTKTQSVRPMHVSPIYVGPIYMGLTPNVSWCKIDVG